MSSYLVTNVERYKIQSQYYDDSGMKIKSNVNLTFKQTPNGFLIPLLVQLYRVDVTILPPDKCRPLWIKDNNYLCIHQPLCKSERYGALCPDDVGSPLVCSGAIQGMMTSRMIDRPCGTGFLDLSPYTKFLTCSVDDSRDVYNHDPGFTFEFTTMGLPTLSVLTVGDDSNETLTSPETTTPPQY